MCVRCGKVTARYTVFKSIPVLRAVSEGRVAINLGYPGGRFLSRMRYSGAVWSGRSVNLHRLQWHAMPSTEGALRYRLTPSAPRRFVWRRPWPSGPSVGRRDRPRAPPDPTDASPGPPEHRVHLFSLHFLRTPLFSALRGHGRLASRWRWSHGSTRRTASRLWHLKPPSWL